MYSIFSGGGENANLGKLPDILAIKVARNSDIGLTYGFTRSAQVRADRLLSPEDRVLLM